MILFLTASQSEKNPLRLEQEFKTIKNKGGVSQFMLS